MRISTITPSGKTMLELKSQHIRLKTPFALLEIEVATGEECNLIVGGRTLSYKPGVYQFDLNLSPSNSETIKIIGTGAAYIFQISCIGGNVIDEGRVENLVHFFNSLSAVPVFSKGQAHVVDLLKAIDTGKITLLSVQKPLTGYDNASLLLKLESILTQKVRAICSSPKQGTRTEEIIQDVSLVKRINTNSLTHLAAHSEHWRARTLNGLIPKRLKADIIEDEINIYENLFFKMAIDDISDFTTRQILAIRKAKRPNQNAIDWEAYGTKINDYRREALLKKLMPGRDSSELNHENQVFDKALKNWMRISKILASIRSSAFYKNIDGRQRISKSIHLTNILKNDQRYKALYDLWRLVQKEKHKEQHEKHDISNDLPNKVENYYATYTIIALLYSMNLLGISFTEESLISVDQQGKLIVNARASDERFTYIVTTQINQFGYNYLDIRMEERVDVVTSTPEECALEADMFVGLESIVTFDKSINELHFHKKPDSEELTILRSVLHKQQSEVRKMSQSEKSIYQKSVAVWNVFLESVVNNQSLHNPRSKNLRLAPIMFDVQADSAVIKHFTDELFVSQGKGVCYLLPLTFENYREVQDSSILHRLLNYGEAFDVSDDDQWKNYQIGILPVTQTDIGSIQRLMKYISVHRSLLTMELESGEPLHCPVCGSRHIRQQDLNTWKCLSTDCGIEWGETHCTKGCKSYFYWIKPDSELSKDDFKCDSACDMILKKDILFDRYIITDFEFELLEDGSFKMYPVCPKCGTRRFETIPSFV